MTQVSICESDIETASRRELQEAHAHTVRIEAEAWPEDPPQSFEDWQRSIRSVPPFWAVHRWLAWTGGQVVASANVHMFNTEHHRHIADGYIGVFWEKGQPATLWQGDTGVLPTYRRHGLGKWLKATMIEKVLAERPEVVRVRTGNANSNAPMLRINEAMGFRPYKD